MLGKRGRQTFRRTTTMNEIDVDVGATDSTIGGRRRGCDDVLSPRYFRSSYYSSDMETADFLTSCSLCNRRLSPGRDIYMYRGNSAFCSIECREQQMNEDERNERLAAAAMAVVKGGESHSLELTAAVPEAETAAAA
ncbi:FCS-Like Zinc finger 3-like [Andrographis paniculata]|uniref:FCS-Like Zinc finger 3-like n=1 Tax=Andrographis paniculata TaxID=175694 RepID=UPI0021E90676|nr:FCS-Like Zinc finger 3-like [Andrographis paniculata]